MNLGKPGAPKPPVEGTLKAVGELVSASMQRQEYGWIDVEELAHMLERGEHVTVVDCRDAATYAFGHIEGAVNVPYRRFMDSHSDIPGGGVIVAACYVGMYSRAAAQKLATTGRGPTFSLKGGMQAWIDAEKPLVADVPPID